MRGGKGVVRGREGVSELEEERLRESWEWGVREGGSERWKGKDMQ